MEKSASTTPKELLTFSSSPPVDLGFVDINPLEVKNVEIWKDIPEYSNYQASTFGRIRSVDRIHTYTTGRVAKIKGRILKMHFNGKYYNCGIWKDGKQETLLTHMLIAVTFIGPRPKDFVVCHEDGDSKNNKLSNLRYGTQKSNIDDKKQHGTYLHGNKHHSTTIPDGDVLKMLSLRDSGMSYKQIGELYNKRTSTIWNILNGKHSRVIIDGSV